MSLGGIMMKRIITFILIVSMGVTGFIKIGQAQEGKSDIDIVVKGSNEFGLDLYAKLKGKEGNLFFSPYSISTALAMTYAGARGETAKQMAEVMHFDLEQKKLHPAFAKIINDLNARGEKGNYKLSVANSLWGQEGYKFLKDFIDLLNKSYGAGLFLVNFKKAAEEARLKINAWAEEKTNNKIKNLIPQKALNKYARLVLVNAIYFKGNWASQFNNENTKEMPFRVKPEKEITVPMMYQRQEYKYLEEDNVQVLEMPYVGEELSMVILLPKATDGLKELEDLLTIKKLDKWCKSLYKEEVNVYLPKFKMTYEFTLKDILMAMGMKDAFIPKPNEPPIIEPYANFLGMGGTRDLYISEGFHKAFVEVNEEGTEAAAVTAIVVCTSEEVPPPPIVFCADHPFLFLIKDNKSGSILFMGRVVNPTA